MLFNAHQCDYGAVSTTTASLNRDVMVVESVARMATTRGLGRATTTSHLLLLSQKHFPHQFNSKKGWWMICRLFLNRIRQYLCSVKPFQSNTNFTRWRNQLDIRNIEVEANTTIPSLPCLRWIWSTRFGKARVI